MRLDGDLAVVEVTRSKACEECKCCYLTDDPRKMVAQAHNKLKAGVGDEVVLEIPPEGYLTAALIVYAIPIVFFLVGYFVGDFVGGNVGASRSGTGIVFSFVFFTLAYVVVALIDRRTRTGDRFEPKIVNVKK
ncbi:MAG: SoxR reducing system RseC family protein [Terriglobia bacterium]